MPHYDSASAECLVFTYKEGLLSSVAHDLKLAVTRFDVDVDEATHAITARFDPTSLRVVTAMHDGAPREGALSGSDKQKIEQSITGEVLETRKHPDIRFVSTSVTPSGDGYRIAGELSLHGRTRSLTLVTRREGDRQVAEVRLHQPDHGIKPYSAMLGALKIKSDVTVRVAVPIAKHIS